LRRLAAEIMYVLHAERGFDDHLEAMRFLRPMAASHCVTSMSTA
jgi:hypothetical protein